MDLLAQAKHLCVEPLHRNFPSDCLTGEFFLPSVSSLSQQQILTGSAPGDQFTFTVL